MAEPTPLSGTRRDADALEREAMAAHLAGRDPDAIDLFTRAHNLHLSHGEVSRAARSAFWVAFVLVGAGELTRASGWIGRARRLLDEDQHDCVERGYVLLPHALEQIAGGDLAGAVATFTDVEHIGERFGDVDIVNLARQGRGRALIGLGQTADGLALFDEVMVAVTAGELMPIVAGVVYCSIIHACVELYDVRRAQEWTDALNDWCATQPGAVAYRGECRTHRARILRLHGKWSAALTEAERAAQAGAEVRLIVRGAAAYEIGELHRVRGEVAAAEAAYTRASDCGRSPYPGLALLRLAQGQVEAARAAIERVMAESGRGRHRADVCAGAVEILLAAGDVAAARRAADELAALAVNGSPCLRALSLHAAGAVRVAAGDFHDALAPLNDALVIWRDLDAPYEAARATALLGTACQGLGDADGARLAWSSASRAFRDLGAAPDTARLAAIMTPIAPGSGGLTAREVEVLRMVASGKTNRAIAQGLAISEKTVARHLSNIFTKLDLSSRAAATAYAFTHHLVE